MKKQFKLILTGTLLLIILPLFAQEQGNGMLSSLKNSTTISGLYYMGYYYDTQSDVQNFSLKRGYFSIKTDLNKTFSIRYTQDITVDKEGGDAGNVEIRLKYLYLKAKLDKIDFLKESYLEIGMVHRPWLELEQHINQFRVQGKMFVERYDIIGSADFGVTMIGLFGGKIDKDYRDKINSKEAGRYGSYAIGVFNGGGYHAIEQNNNKIIESRITLRPFPGFMPGLQFSHGFAYGLGNTAVEPIPEFMMNVFMVSSESVYHKATAQYYMGKGNDAGDYIDESGNALNNQGYSFFGEFYIPKTDFSVFGRYDYFSQDDDIQTEINTVITGVAYRFLKNKVLLDWQRSQYPSETVDYFELALEIGF